MVCDYGEVGGADIEGEGVAVGGWKDEVDGGYVGWKVVAVDGSGEFVDIVGRGAWKGRLWRRGRGL